MTFTDSRRGLGLATGGVGFAGRKAPGPDVPVTEAEIDLKGIPTGAVVQTTYLYFVHYGTDGVDTLTIDGTPITGTLIGTSASTCWGDYTGAFNRVYRADVTALAKTNGKYKLTDLPLTVPGISDGQGASLVVIYDNPTSTDRGTVHLMDGAITVDPGNSGQGTFPSVVGDGVTAATFRLGVGDGQVEFFDGPLNFNTMGLPAVDGGHFYPGSAGAYWDDLSFDVLARIPKGTKNLRWSQSYFNDCVVFAYTALVLTNPLGPPDGGADAGLVDGGTPGPGPGDGGSIDGGGGGGGGGGASDGGASDAESEGGCGCHIHSTASAAPGALLALAALGVVARLQRRHRKNGRRRGS